MLNEDELADLFAAFGPVRSRRMFGGAGLYAEGVMFAIDTGEGVFLKADAAFAADLEARGCARFTYLAKGRPMSLPYWSLPEEALDSPEEMAELARRALAVARASAVKKKTRKA
ncbi:TfoX/Sxy family protein [Aquabacter sp. CN5-332]|uniref:TfoX/Sxy family protein n=1 Tax=Aquabacter sp. CN5-332 TaxID=3156608 RepID=UPI0032B4DFC0